MANPAVNEPGDSGSTTVDVCIRIDSAGPLERAGVITFNTVAGTAGTLLLGVLPSPHAC